jgi:hypothetical protein
MASLPEECQKPVIGDTFAVKADAASRLLPELLRDSCRIIFDRLEQLNPNVHIEAVVGLDLDKLLGPKKERPIAFLEKEERYELAIKTAGEVLRFRERLKSLTEEFIKLGPIQNQWIGEKIGVIDKILADEFKIKRDAEGKVTEISLLSDKKKGPYRIASAVDREATFRVHGENKINFGYNPNVMATENFTWRTKCPLSRHQESRISAQNGGWRLSRQTLAKHSGRTEISLTSPQTTPITPSKTVH